MAKRRRRGPVRATEKRSRTATTARTGNAAWKRAERDVARYFGTERVGLGRAGHDLAEMPTIKSWLSLRAPDLIYAEGAYHYEPEWKELYSHIAVDSKCHKSLIPTLEQWQSVVESNPDKKHFKPVLFLGERDFSLPVPLARGVIGLCKLDDFPVVYRSFLMHPPQSNSMDFVQQVLYRFWLIRRPVAPLKLITDAINQAWQAGYDWKKKQPESSDVRRVLPVAYLYYPKRLTPALAFHAGTA